MRLLNKTTSLLVKNILVLCFISCFYCSNAQVRIQSVDPLTDQISFKNYGTVSVDITQWWVCARFVYTCIDVLTIEDGNPILLPNQTVTVSGFNLNNTSSDLGLFDTPAFSSTSAMQDFMQYGAGGIGRENVAVAKGIWDAGTFINNSVSPPFGYIGNGTTDNGVTFWDSVLSLPDYESEFELKLSPNPNSGTFTITSSSLHTFNLIKVVNLQGVVVYQRHFEDTTSKTINLNVSAGCYLVSIQQNKTNTQIKKLVIR